MGEKSLPVNPFAPSRQSRAGDWLALPIGRIIVTPLAAIVVVIWRLSIAEKRIIQALEAL